MHLSKKLSKTHLNSCNFTGGNALITIISLVRLCMHLCLKRHITQALFSPIFLNFHILYSFICSIYRYITHIMHLGRKYRKTHLYSCNFTGGNALITINSLVRLCMHLWLKRPITQPLFCPIFLNFHILYSFICSIYRYVTHIMHLGRKYRKTHLYSCNFTGGNSLITIISLVRLCMHLCLKRHITQALFCPIFLNFHILYSFICSIYRYMT